LMDHGMDGPGCLDSTRTLLSKILPKAGERLAFKYEYDFGDGWIHEVLFEGCPTVDPGAKYPQCLEGERACPPEDCGGVWSYQNFLEVLGNPKHEEYASVLEWLGGPIEPDKFDAQEATQAMHKGLRS
jgi:Plasmid pRiA4b ORF-3-like protein